MLGVGFSNRHGALALWMGLDTAMSRADHLEEAARVADMFADENIAMAQDTILLDPCLRDRDFSTTAVARHEDLTIKGCVHSSMYHAAKNIAAAIRRLK